MQALLYRAPEILLDEAHYSYKVDQWSIGCIVAELLQFSYGKRSKGPMDSSLSLFYVNESKEAAETKANGEEVDLEAPKISRNQKQIQRIVSILGEQQPEDVSFVSNKACRENILNFEEFRKSLAKRFKKSSAGVVEMLE